MRGVRHETTETLLGTTPLFEGRFDACEHRVEGDSEPPDLGLLVGRLHTACEVPGGDRIRGLAHPLERLQADADEPQREPGNDEERDRAHEELDAHQMPERQMHLGQWDRDDDGSGRRLAVLRDRHLVGEHAIPRGTVERPHGDGSRAVRRPHRKLGGQVGR